MTWYPAYLDSKQDIVDWASDQNPNLTTGDIKDVDVKMADIWIFAQLRSEGIDVDYTGTVSGSTSTPSDRNYMLWAASLSYNLEFLAYRGSIYYAPGGIQKTRFGDITYEFMKMQPMFFMQSGGKSLDNVMPFRSYKQLGQQFVDAYIRAYWKDTLGSTEVCPVISWDASSRGFAWNANIDDYIKTADREFDTGIV